MIIGIIILFVVLAVIAIVMGARESINNYQLRIKNLRITNLKIIL